MPGLTKRDWQNALDVQSASNMSGVVTSFNDVIGRIRCEPDYSGSDYTARHPIVIMYLNQMLWLSLGAIMPEAVGEGRIGFGEAYTKCLQMAEVSVDHGVRS